MGEAEKKFSIKPLMTKLGYDKDKQGVSLIEWAILALIMLFCFLTFSYVDLQTIISHTVTFVKSVFSGDFSAFYEISIAARTQEWAANYEFIVYLFMAIINFPVMIAAVGFNVDVANSVWCVLWEKAILVAFALLCAKVVMLLFKEYGLDKKRSLFGVFMFMSSLYTVIITTVQSQLEIIIVYLMLLGIYYYIKDDMKKFVLFFALSVPLKMVSIFVFIPLLLLKVKNIWKIIGSLVCAMALLVISKLPFMGNEVYSSLMGANSKMSLDGFGFVSVKFGAKRISIFVFAFVCLCVYCFVKNLKDRNETIYLSAYIPMVVMGGLVVLFPCSSYWFALVAPFIVLTTMANPKYLTANMLLEVGMSVGWMVFCFTNAAAFTNLIRTGRTFLLMKLFAPSEGMEYTYKGVQDFLVSKNLDQYTYYFFTLMVACFVMFVIINLPYKKDSIGNRQHIDYTVLWIRILSVVCMLGFVFLVGITKNPVAVFDSTKAKASVSDTMFKTDETEIVQTFTASDTRELQSLTMKFDLKKMKRASVRMIKIRLCNDNGDSIFETSKGLYVLPDNKNITFKVKNANLEKGKNYSVKVTQIYNDSSDKYGTAQIYLTDKCADGLKPCTVNGEVQTGCIYMKLV